MIDINLIRQDDSRQKVLESEKKRFRDGESVNIVYELDKKRIRLNYELDAANRTVNQLQRQIKHFYKESKKAGNSDANEKKAEIQALIDESNKNSQQATLLQEEVKQVENEISNALKRIGNIVHDDVYVSKDEAENPVVRSYRTERPLPANPQPFSALMKDYTYAEAGARVVGHRGYYLAGKMAKLQQALVRYAIDFLDNKGYTLIQPPVMLRKDVMAKTSQLSDFDDQLYKVEDDMYLVATSEQPLCALFMGERLLQQDLPKKLCGQSLCFRKEAGAHGKDNAGLFRIHQFEKIEQFVVCAPEDSERIHNEMIKTSEEFYRSLEISYNVVNIVSGELNDAASIKYDLEAYFPNAGKYRELVYCSNCTDYQSRELEIRYGITKDEGKKVYVHLLNGTLCAIQRTLCCIVENYQAPGKIIVPEVLRGYFNGDHIDLEE